MDPQDGKSDDRAVRQHFVLVHGFGHGAWCWYKLKPMLESAGHRVTALDMAASGIDTRTVRDVGTLSDYSAPLMEFMALVPPNEKVVLVGHSLGGMNLALAMDRFPEKIAVAVFLTAVLPDTRHRPSYVMEENRKAIEEGNGFMDSEISTTTMLFGPEFSRSRLYQLCSEENYTLGMMLMRPGSTSFIEDLSKAENFSEEGFGWVKKAFIVCVEDKVMSRETQRWMIENNGGVGEVMELPNADHMAMLSTPHQLCNSLLQIASKYH